MVQNAGGLLRGDKENLIGNRAFRPLGRLVNRYGLLGIRHGDGNRGGAAAVQSQNRGTAQLKEAFGGLIERGPDRVPADSAINGIEN